jgi:hypothetical protein
VARRSVRYILAPLIVLCFAKRGTPFPTPLLRAKETHTHAPPFFHSVSKVFISVFLAVVALPLLENG